MADSSNPCLLALREWFHSQGWTPHRFQEEAWQAALSGRSGLLHVPTGAGKTYAAAMGPFARAMAERMTGAPAGLRVLYITPLRAVARDVAKALERPLLDLGWAAAPPHKRPPLRVATRTGDTGSAERSRQRRRLPEILVTTPESLAVMLASERHGEDFAHLQAVILDEWHELLGTKRGSLLELNLARLRAMHVDRQASEAGQLITWALSATLANLDDAAAAAVGADPPHPPVTIRAELKRPVHLETLLPEDLDSFPWAGHLGKGMVQQVVARLDPRVPTLVFTNTRSQAERWYQAIAAARPEWFDLLALHHGSLDREAREQVEQGIKGGRIPIVVCTSSLDLGVDFAPVERVIQIGSPRGIARLLQRAGRAAHRPDTPCHVLCVPTHALELVEYAAVRDAMDRGDIEPRRVLKAPLDVLAQHLVSMATGGGFRFRQALREARSTVGFRDLPESTFRWLLRLLTEGGEALQAYPGYRKLQRDSRGVYRMTDRRAVRLHRLNIGTITSDGQVMLRFVGGKRLGSVEENFVARLRPGEAFLYGGRTLRLVRQHDGDVFVRTAQGTTTHTPRWMGGRLPISTCLSRGMRRVLAGQGCAAAMAAPELAAVAPVLAEQERRSALPEPDGLLLETLRTRQGAHLFVYPFEGRLVHEGLAALLAARLAERQPGTFSLAANDHGLEVHCAAKDYPFQRLLDPDGDGALRGARELLRPDGLDEAIAAGVSLGDMARRRFRDVARVSGLVQQRLPGQQRSLRHLQTSAGLLFDVFIRHDPDNLLVHQARREVLEEQFERSRLLALLERLTTGRWTLQTPTRPTPFAFPLIVERARARLTNETIEERVARLMRHLGVAQDDGASREAAAG